VHNTLNGICYLLVAVATAASWVRIVFRDPAEREFESQVRMGRFIQARPALKWLLSWLEIPPKDRERYNRQRRLLRKLALLLYLPLAIMFGWMGLLNLGRW